MFGVPLHFFVVHFPVALLCAAAFYDLKGRHETGYRLTLGGAAAAAFAVLTGLLLAGGRLAEIAVHAGSGIAGSLLAVVLAMFRYSRAARERETQEAFPAAWLILQLLAAGFILFAAWAGHRAVLGY